MKQKKTSLLLELVKGRKGFQEQGINKLFSIGPALFLYNESRRACQPIYQEKPKS